ncbi:uncharacterized protein LOC116201138 [Punica granatum]|uniref:Uncharacterized protein LOC116201138 n=1 Tax=Punica granatum TaxID=22663 RepID=A0A6P8D3D8_PUNGR|nr:uncharacterized protein LOC116201138 [Punica granatum]
MRLPATTEAADNLVEVLPTATITLKTPLSTVLEQERVHQPVPRRHQPMVVITSWPMAKPPLPFTPSEEENECCRDMGVRGLFPVIIYSREVVPAVSMVTDNLVEVEVDGEWRCFRGAGVTATTSHPHKDTDDH